MARKNKIGGITQMRKKDKVMPPTPGDSTDSRNLPKVKRKGSVGKYHASRAANKTKEVGFESNCHKKRKSPEPIELQYTSLPSQKRMRGKDDASTGISERDSMLRNMRKSQTAKLKKKSKSKSARRR